MRASRAWNLLTGFAVKEKRELQEMGFRLSHGVSGVWIEDVWRAIIVRKGRGSDLVTIAQS